MQRSELAACRSQDRASTTDTCTETRHRRVKREVCEIRGRDQLRGQVRAAEQVCQCKSQGGVLPLANLLSVWREGAVKTRLVSKEWTTSKRSCKSLTTTGLARSKGPCRDEHGGKTERTKRPAARTLEDSHKRMQPRSEYCCVWEHAPHSRVEKISPDLGRLRIQRKDQLSLRWSVVAHI